MKKTLHIIEDSLAAVSVILAVSMMVFTLISVNTLQPEQRSIGGYRAFIVLSDSMSKTDFSAGDLIVTKETNPSLLKEGDIISYVSKDPENNGSIVTHKIRSLVEENGMHGFITYGTTTDTDDRYTVFDSDILGKYLFRIPKIGFFLQYLRTIQGYFFCIFLPFVFLIALQAINCIRLFQAYKKEQMDEIQAEKEKTQKIMEELIILKKQLEEQSRS